MKRNRLLALLEGAAMIALATVLSLVKVIDMPFGGSVTACAMLPIILVAYRRGVKWGLLTATVYAVLQMLLGFSNLQYATSFAALIAIILLDYIVAFGVLGLGGLFRNKMSSQTNELLIATVLCCVLRYICHFISGCTVWAGVSIPELGGMIYSATYNAAYMLPETIVTLAGAWYLTHILNFKGDKITANKDKQPTIVTVLEGVGILALVVGIVSDALYLFGHLQTEDGFDWSALSTMNPIVLLAVTGVAVLVWGILYLVAKQIKSKV